LGRELQRGLERALWRHPRMSDFTILITLGLGLLVGISLVVLAFRMAAREPGPAVFGAGLLLVLCLLSLELFLRIGFQYDLVRGHAPLRSFDGAPVLPLLGALILLGAGACVITFGIAVALLVRVWRKTHPSWLLMSTALAPPMLVLAFQYVAAGAEEASIAAASSAKAASEAKAAEEARSDELSGFGWAQGKDIARENACSGPSGAFIQGCLRLVRSKAQMSEESIAYAGKNWARNHRVESEEIRSSSPLADFDERPAFIAGCKDAVRELHQMPAETRARLGKYGRSYTKIVREDDCRPGTAGFHDDPEFIAGCRRKAAEALRAAGTH
jgi:hypothetical protein